MPTFKHDNLDFYFVDEGEGEPIVLVHGFASNLEINWIFPNWVSTLRKAGRRVIALDNRGHGRSSKPHDPKAYGLPIMGADVLALLDHVEVERADYLGYSMGGRIGMLLALTHPVRIRSAILGGIGASLITGAGTGRPYRRRTRGAERGGGQRPDRAFLSASLPMGRNRTSRRSPPA